MLSKIILTALLLLVIYDYRINNLIEKLQVVKSQRKAFNPTTMKRIEYALK